MTTVTCSWYALCDRPAVGVVAHPVLGGVPTCQRCADKHDLDVARYEVGPGTPATIHLYSDTTAAVVTRVSAKSVWVQRVDTDRSSQRCTNPDEPYPCLVWDGDLSKPYGDPERYTRTEHGAKKGSIRVTFGQSIEKRDYRY